MLGWKVNPKYEVQEPSAHREQVCFMREIGSNGLTKADRPTLECMKSRAPDSQRFRQMAASSVRGLILPPSKMPNMQASKLNDH